jgi:hypothetical protein
VGVAVRNRLDSDGAQSRTSTIYEDVMATTTVIRKLKTIAVAALLEDTAVTDNQLTIMVLADVEPVVNIHLTFDDYRSHGFKGTALGTAI